MFKFARQSRLGLQDQFQAIALSQIARAQKAAEAQEGGADDAIHEVRKRCKKLRGLLRLVGPAFGDFKQEDAFIRDAARAMSELRDAQVLRETLDTLLANEGPAAAPLAHALLCANPAGGNDAAAKQAMLAGFADAMRALTRRAVTWTLNGQGFGTLRPGLRRTYARGRKAMRKAAVSGTPEDFHEWRKAVKAHGHHLGLLRDAAPDLLLPAAQLAARLGDSLGDHHNLAVLASRLDQAGAAVPPTEKDVLSPRIAAQMKALEETAMLLGRQLFAERPMPFAQRIAGYWKN